MRTPFALLLLFALLFAACGDADPETDPEAETDATEETDLAPTPRVARAELQPTEGNDASGEVTFTEAEDGVRVVAAVTGLADGLHGFHIHENGDCSDNAQAAGGHYNPGGHPHGAPDAPTDQRHIGDLGNLEVSGGNALYERVDEVLSLEGPDSIVGKAVVVHGGEDDLESQPSGDAGARVACGVIQMVGDAAM